MVGQGISEGTYEERKECGDIQAAKQLMPDGFKVGSPMGTWHNPRRSQVHDKAIDESVAEHVATTWHSLGTCGMNPRKQGGVVDKQPDFFGTQNLKRVDSSICHDNLGTNTLFVSLVTVALSWGCAPPILLTRLVGEKETDLIAEELGLKIEIPHALVPRAPVPACKPMTQQVR